MSSDRAAKKATAEAKSASAAASAASAAPAAAEDEDLPTQVAALKRTVEDLQKQLTDLQESLQTQLTDVQESFNDRLLNLENGGSIKHVLENAILMRGMIGCGPFDSPDGVTDAATRSWRTFILKDTLKHNVIEAPVAIKVIGELFTWNQSHGNKLPAKLSEQLGPWQQILKRVAKESDDLKTPCRRDRLAFNPAKSARDAQTTV